MVTKAVILEPIYSTKTVTESRFVEISYWVTCCSGVSISVLSGSTNYRLIDDIMEYYIILLYFASNYQRFYPHAFVCTDEFLEDFLNTKIEDMLGKIDITIASKLPRFTRLTRSARISIFHRICQY